MQYFQIHILPTGYDAVSKLSFPILITINIINVILCFYKSLNWQHRINIYVKSCYFKVKKIILCNENEWNRIDKRVYCAESCAVVPLLDNLF